MKLGRLNHIGVATPSIADSIAHYRDTLGATAISDPFDMAEQGVRDAGRFLRLMRHNTLDPEAFDQILRESAIPWGSTAPLPQPMAKCIARLLELMASNARDKGISTLASISSALGIWRSIRRIVCDDMNMIAVSTTERSSSRLDRSESSNTVSAFDMSTDASPVKKLP